MGKFKSQLLPIIFSTVLASAVMYIFAPESAVAYSAVALLLTGVFFAFFEFTKNRGKLAPLIYSAVMIIISFVSFYLISGASELGLEAFTQFFYGNSFEEMPVSLYCGIMVVVISFVISSFVFYFTNVAYRSSVVFLIMLIPCIIYAKRFQEIPMIFLVLMIASYMAVMIHCKQISISKSVNVVMDNSYRKSLSVFMLVTVIVAVIIPKPHITPYRNVLDSLLSNSDVEVGVSGRLGESSNTSGAHDYNNALSNKVILTMNASEPIYLRKQVFDIYNGERWEQYNENKFHYGSPDWEEDSYVNDYSLFQKAVVSALSRNKSLAEKYGVSLSENDIVSSKKKSAEIICDSFHSSYFLNAINTSWLYSSRSKTFKSESGEIFVSGSSNMPNSYTIEYFPESAYSKSVLNFAKQFDREKYVEFLMDLFASDISKDDKKVISYVLIDYYSADAYLENTGGFVIPEIRSLAFNITKDCKSDLEKALALQNYFSENGFEYDQKYVPKKNDIEYFIFESKKGSCIDFATAMTIMARYVNLPTRYVEGFMADEESGDGEYVVRETDSHAFPEVYISGIGWMTFEPTVSYDGVVSGFEKKGKSSFLASLDGKMIATLLACLAVIFATVILLTPFISERYFRTALKFRSRDKKISALFLHARKITADALSLSAESLSAGTLCEISKENFGTDVSALSEAFNRQCYGGEKISDGEISSAYKNYISLFKAIKSRKKHKNHF